MKSAINDILPANIATVAPSKEPMRMAAPKENSRKPVKNVYSISIREPKFSLYERWFLYERWIWLDDIFISYNYEPKKSNNTFPPISYWF